MAVWLWIKLIHLHILEENCSKFSVSKIHLSQPYIYLDLVQSKTLNFSVNNFYSRPLRLRTMGVCLVTGGNTTVVAFAISVCKLIYHYSGLCGFKGWLTRPTFMHCMKFASMYTNPKIICLLYLFNGKIFCVFNFHCNLFHTSTKTFNGKLQDVFVSVCVCVCVRACVCVTMCVCLCACIAVYHDLYHYWCTLHFRQQLKYGAHAIAGLIPSNLLEERYVIPDTVSYRRHVRACQGSVHTGKH